jgi:hypothetical protein
MATRRTTPSPSRSESQQSVQKAAPRARTAPVSPSPGSDASNDVSVSEDARRALVAQAAYLRAERRGFAPGGEVEDWLAAEAEVDALLKAGNGRLPQ